MFYYALINLGLGEIGPSSPIEYIFCWASMIISSLFFNYVFGQVSNQYTIINRQNTIQESMINEINDVLSTLDLSIEHRNQIQYYY